MLRPRSGGVPGRDAAGSCPCVSPPCAVYVGVTTQVAFADSADFAYERAYEEHWSDVFRFALAWTNDWAAAEDLAQEAYLRLWDHRARLDWDRPVLPWLLVTTRRLATDRFRALRRRLLPLPPPATLDTAVQVRWLDVSAAMSSLSPLERTAIVMTAVEGASYEEAGLVLGTTAGALRAAVSRARTKLETA
jgi:RNA polymerase sigma factor (sigma-70 family)